MVTDSFSGEAAPPPVRVVNLPSGYLVVFHWFRERVTAAFFIKWSSRRTCDGRVITCKLN